MASPFLLYSALIIPVLAAIACPWAMRRPSRWSYAIPFAGTVLPFLALLALLSAAMHQGEPLVFSSAWVESLGLTLSFIIDGFGGVFAALVAGIGILIVWYARFYMEEERGVGRFFGFLLLFLAAMLGIAVSEHFLVLYLFWELTSISSFFLIGFWHEKEASRAGALKALLITSIGGLALLGGLVLFGAKTGAWTWSAASQAVASSAGEPWLTVAFILVLIGVFTKSAQVPFHIWLPDAMEAPTPVSAFLHSATMVKAGVFLLFRLFPVFGDHPLWFPLLASVGMATFFTGSLLAFRAHDLKAILAYTTIAQLGLFVTLHGYTSFDAALRASLIFHIAAHAFYKAALFMLTGIIDHGTGTRDTRRLGHLAKSMPRTSAFMLLAAGSLAGLPPFLGFISKESALDASIAIANEAGRWAWLLPAALTAGATLTVAVAVTIGYRIFFRDAENKTADHHPHEASWGFLLSPALAAVAGLLFGLFPSLLETLLFPAALVGLTGISTPHFSLWHGITPALGLSALAVTGGVGLYAIRDRVRRLLDRASMSWDLNTVYDRSWEITLAAAKKLTVTLQNGSLSRYTVVTVLSTAALIGLAALQVKRSIAGRLSLPSLDFEIFAAAGIIAASLLVVFLRDRFARILSLGAIGILIVIFFILRGAPDLALTGFLVEIVMFVLVLVIFKQLADEPVTPESSARRGWLGAAAAVAGGTIGLLLYIALQFPIAPSIAYFYTQTSSALAGGLNIVNVIVVDFRGFDTMGEISVLCLAGLGVYALRRVWTISPERAKAPRDLHMRTLPSSPILKAVSAWAFPLIVAFSFYMVFRGHNNPGGGFIGGLITASGLILELFAVGRVRFLRLLPMNPRFLYSLGLTLAFATGFAPLFFGYPFLTSFVVESIHFSTASIFDLGVYFVVVGVTVDMIVLIEESERGAA